MPKFKLSLTGAGGGTVGEGVVEKVGREHALTEGLVEVLQLPEFPPEAASFAAEAFARGTDLEARDLVNDLLLEKWGLQVFCVELNPEPEKLNPAPARDTAAVAPGASPTALVAPSPLSTSSADRSPRQILQAELKRLNTLIAGARADKLKIDRYYNHLRQRREECLQLLKPPAKGNAHARPAKVRAVASA